jgi:hypothetical protein
MTSRLAGRALLMLAGTLAAGSPAGAVPAGVAGPPAALARPSGNPLDEARRAAAQASFVGVMQVRWRDGAQKRVERVTVRAERGSLFVTGGTQLMAAPTSERLVQHGDSWDLLWPAGLGPEARPDAAGKYRVDTREGPLVAGLRSTVFDISRHDRRRERLHLHTDTSLLLSREQFDDRGETVRYVGFEALTLTPEVPVVPPAPTDHGRRVPRAMPASVGGAFDGYQRLGAYRRSDVVQTLYSDGLYDLSVFEQPGRLRRDDLPDGGAAVEVAGGRGWRYAWPGGNLVIWEADGTVFTAVGDAPLDDILLAARSVPPPRPRDASLWVKLRAACATLVQPVGR